MMQYFNFEYLLDKYAVPFTLIVTGKGSYGDAGKFVKAEDVTTEEVGAIIGFQESKIYNSGGVLTAKDKRLFFRRQIPLDTAAHVVYGGCKFKVEEERLKEDAQWTGVYSYTLKYVSLFGEVGSNG